MLVDTHTHLYLPEFADDGCAAAVDRAVDAGVSHMILPNVDLTTIDPLKKLRRKRPDVTSAAMGFHPTEVDANWRENMSIVIDELRIHTEDYVAVGEIGIDLYWNSTFCEEQMMALEEQLRLAVEIDLPVIIHCRNGLDQTLEVIEGVNGTRGVMHSFGGSPKDVERVLSTNENFMFGLNGIATFKNSRVCESLPAITTKRLLLETDSPYLAPVPFRGRRCESAMLVNTAAHIASQLGIAREELEAITTANASQLFRLHLT